MKKLTFFSLFLLMGIGAMAQMARVQAIHNCGDAGAASVDIYLDNTLLIDNFGYLQATPYIDAPAGTQFTLSVCAPNSTDTVGAIFKKNFTLMAGETYSVIASGGLAETGATAFDLRAYAGKESATNAGEVDVNIIHSSYDAPTVDIIEVQLPAGPLVQGLSFGDDLGGYGGLPALDFDVQVALPNGIVVAQYDLNATTLADSAAIIMAKGFVDPANAAGSEPFGVVAILPSGTVIPLPSQNVTPARLQVLHNCAATDAAEVDVWLNGTKLIPNFAFRTASPFIDAPAGEVLEVAITLPNATDTMGALHQETFLLGSNRGYTVIASGVIGSGTYNPNEPFMLMPVVGTRETAITPGNVAIAVWHGATDAPMVDVVETQVGLGTLVDDISYGEVQGYIDAPADDYDLEVTTADGSSVIAKFDANITALADQAIMILASGFADPSMNNNGAAFGLFAALPAGGAFVPLDMIMSVGELSSVSEVSIFPNPVQDNLNFSYTTSVSTNYTIEIMDLTGKTLSTQVVEGYVGSNKIELNTQDFVNGMYFIKLHNNEGQKVIPFVKQ